MPAFRLRMKTQQQDNRHPFHVCLTEPPSCVGHPPGYCDPNQVLTPKKAQHILSTHGFCQLYIVAMAYLAGDADAEDV